MTRRRMCSFLSAVALLAPGLLLLAGPVEAARLAQQPSVPLFEQILAMLAHPTVAYFLFVLGLLGLVGELITPGATFPAVSGTICLVLGLVGLGQLPTNWGGAALIIAGVLMFLFDLKVPGHGLSVGGIIAFSVGSLLIFTPFWAVRPIAVESATLNPWVVLGTTLGVAVFFMAGAAVGLRAQNQPVAVGRETLIGKVGTVRQALRPEGIVHLEGEEYTALSSLGDEIGEGASVRVVGVDGLKLQVEPIDEHERRLAPLTGEVSQP